MTLCKVGEATHLTNEQGSQGWLVLRVTRRGTKKKVLTTQAQKRIEGTSARSTRQLRRLLDTPSVQVDGMSEW